jgi:voltage-dependent potassium channel beta subunit
MEYRYLGPTGLRVSVFSFGNWVNNEKDKLTVDSVKFCLEHGINFFDTAESYGLGMAETSLGKAFKELNVQREKIVVTTKIYRCGFDPNDSFLSRKHIIEGVRNSLKRLQLDYVDVVFCHRYDRYTPLEETCRAMNWVINQGLAHYWGTSQWSASQIMEAYKICDKLNLIPPIVEQTHYNLMTRDWVEREYRDLFARYKMGTTVWSPLESGVLAGRYLNGIPEDSRFNIKHDGAQTDIQPYLDHKKEWDEKLLKLKDIAEKN